MNILEKRLLDVIEEREKLKEERFDLLSLMMQSRDGNDILTKREIIADAWIFFLAGHDTTASQLTSTLYVLSKYPEIQEKIYEEIQKIDENSTMEDYSALKYTNNVVSESLRMYPPVGAISKIALKDTEFNGIKIPEKTICIMNFLALHNQTKSWSDSDQFNPDRFNGQVVTGSYLPFSLGQRKCIGFKFSLTESSVMIAEIVKKFKILPCEKDYVFKRQGGIVLRASDLKLKFEKRK